MPTDPDARESGGAGLSAIVLAGGTAARMGGVDKAGIEHEGTTFLEHALAATVDADETVVVGEPVPTSRPVTFAREDPPLGGPAAGLLAGRDHLTRPSAYVVVLAVDMPLVTRDTVARLVRAAHDHDAAVLVAPDGRRRLVLVVRADRLPAYGSDVHGRPLWSLLDGLDVADVPAEGSEASGVDTWADLRDLGS